MLEHQDKGNRGPGALNDPWSGTGFKLTAASPSDDLADSSARVRLTVTAVGRWPPLPSSAIDSTANLKAG